MAGINDQVNFDRMISGTEQDASAIMTGFLHQRLALITNIIMYIYNINTISASPSK